MYTKTITYNNFLGQQITKTFYFNISSSEFLQNTMLNESTDIMTLFKQAQQPNTNQEQQGQIVLNVLSKLLEMGYGEISEDGESFIKKDKEGNALYNRFVGTIPFDKIFMELITNTEEATKFIQNVLPVEEIQKLTNNKQLQMPVAGSVPYMQ